MKRRVDIETKEEKLEHYKKRELTRFAQYDGFYLPDGGDDLMRPDEDRHWVACGETNELMTGCYSVRVLIPENAEREEVIKILLKIIDWIQTDPPYPEHWSLPNLDWLDLSVLDKD